MERRLKRMSPISKCGYFDNGYDTEHEHRRNCRKCLMERIIALTAQVAILREEKKQLEALANGSDWKF